MARTICQWHPGDGVKRGKGHSVERGVVSRVRISRIDPTHGEENEGWVASVDLGGDTSSFNSSRNGMAGFTRDGPGTRSIAGRKKTGDFVRMPAGTGCQGCPYPNPDRLMIHAIEAEGPASAPVITYQVRHPHEDGRFGPIITI
jgi:hypothetical protein